MGNDCENANTYTLGGVGTFTKEVVFAGVRWVWVPLDSALSGKWNAYFLLRRMQILGGWHIGARVKKLEEKGIRSNCLTVTGR